MIDHPITPPPELVEDWIELAKPLPQRPPNPGEFATLAARWGADQELEACCEWLNADPELAQELRTSRRPKPPSLKEQALDDLDGIAAVFRMSYGGDLICDKIRRALEALPE